MRSKKSKNRGNILINIVIYLIAFIVLIPFILMFLTTFKDPDHLYDALMIPNFTYIDNYVSVFKNVHIFKAFGNTLLICGGTELIIILFGSMAGYMISRSKELFFKVIYMLFVSGLIVPTQTAMVVIFKLGVATHLINTIPFLILIYASGSSAFAALIYVGFTTTIPLEMDESAAIDGCGIYRTFFKIIFPLLMPATGTVFVTTIFWYWNDFAGPLIYLNGSKVQTLIMAIFAFSSQNLSTAWGPVFALCFIASLPMIIFFLFAQKHLLEGLTAGAVKG